MILGRLRTGDLGPRLLSLKGIIEWQDGGMTSFLGPWYALVHSANIIELG